MIESPLTQELTAKGGAKRAAQGHIMTRKQDLIRVLAVRFGAVTPEIDALIQTMDIEETLEALVDWAAQCPDLQSFRTRLVSHSSPAS